MNGQNRQINDEIFTESVDDIINMLNHKENRIDIASQFINQPQQNNKNLRPLLSQQSQYTAYNSQIFDEKRAMDNQQLQEISSNIKNNKEYNTQSGIKMYESINYSGQKTNQFQRQSSNNVNDVELDSLVQFCSSLNKNQNNLAKLPPKLIPINQNIVRYLQFKPWNGQNKENIIDNGYHFKLNNCNIKLVRGLLEENGFKVLFYLNVNRVVLNKINYSKIFKRKQQIKIGLSSGLLDPQNQKYIKQ